MHTHATLIRCFRALALALLLVALVPASRAAELFAMLQAQDAPDGALWLDSYGATPPSAAALHGAGDLRIGSLTFAHGIGAHVIREWTMPVPAGAAQLVAAVGLRPGADAKQQATVSFLTDGAPASAPIALASVSAPALALVKLVGKQSLTLRIDVHEVRHRRRVLAHRHHHLSVAQRPRRERDPLVQQAHGDVRAGDACPVQHRRAENAPSPCRRRGGERQQ